MSLVIELGTTEEIKSSSKAGLANQALVNKTDVEFFLIRKWEKDGSTKTKLGYTGVISNLGFTNANQIFTAWFDLPDRFDGLFTIKEGTGIEAKPASGKKAAGPAIPAVYELVIDPAVHYLISGDERGNIVSIKEIS